MRLHARIIALASAAVLAASSTPASAFENETPSGPSTPPASVAAARDSDSPELVLELATGGALVLLGGGIAATRQRRRPGRPDPTPDAARGS
jgi:hypothetical protein